MSEHETSTLTSRLNHLADELTPSADPVVQVRGARTRYRRQRRNRVVASGLIAAAAALIVGVPVAIGSLSAAPERGEVAGPSETPPSETPPPGKTPGPPPEGEDAGKASRWTDMLDEKAERDERLRPYAERLAAALGARATPVSLSGPPMDGACPDWAAVLTTAVGTAMEGPDGALPAGCRWSGAEVAVEVAFEPGSTREELGDDASAEATSDGCYVQAMPGGTLLTPLLLCEEEGAMSWRLQNMDAGGVGVWRLTVTLADSYPGDGAVVLADLTDLADRTW